MQTFLVLALICALPVWATELPLLNVRLLDVDTHNLRVLGAALGNDELLQVFTNFYPEVSIQKLPDYEMIEGSFTPAFDGEVLHPRLQLKKDFERTTAFHEFLHFMIDRARLAKWPEETVQKSRSYRWWMIEKGREFEVERHGTLPQARRLVNLLEACAYTQGEEVEIFVYLLRHREILNLNQSHLLKLYRHAEDQQNTLLEKMVGLSALFKFEISPASNWRDAIRLGDEIADLQRLMKRVQELGLFLKSAECASLLQ